MVWRLESLSHAGLEGTVLGTLIMPYCSGLGNLIFAFVLGRSHGNSEEVMTNCLVNNVTNMTLLIGAPALWWGLSLSSKKSKPARSGAEDKQRIHRLSLVLTIIAAAFFTGVAWALGRDGIIGFSDGLVLVGIFLFWQTFHVFEVLKGATRHKGTRGAAFLINLALLLLGAYAVYMTTDWLVRWVGRLPRRGLVNAENLGWLSGWLMVMPNALLALYYGWRKRAEVVYSSQMGDGHICIPLCIGVFALFRDIPTPRFFELGVWLLLGATTIHFIFVTFFNGLPRFMGAALIVAYALFVWRGFGG